MRGLALVVLVSLAGTARADSPCEDEARVSPEPCSVFASKRRVTHMAITVGAGALYILSEAALKVHLAPVDCKWCNPPGFDASVRDAIVWGDHERAATLSNITGYVTAPITMIGLVVFGTVSGGESNTKLVRTIDHVMPLIETVALSQVGIEIVKFAVGRQRPYAHFEPPMPHTPEDNLSFFSGHSALTFALVTGAGTVAHRYHMGVEPIIWGVGLPLAGVTAYLRMAGDRHYLSDVVTGSVVGAVAGLLIPRWSLPEPVHIVPTSNGAALALEW